jgi:hypothetical protein
MAYEKEVDTGGSPELLLAQAIRLKEAHNLQIEILNHSTF